MRDPIAIFIPRLDLGTCSSELSSVEEWLQLSKGHNAFLVKLDNAGLRFDSAASKGICITI